MIQRMPTMFLLLCNKAKTQTFGTTITSLQCLEILGLGLLAASDGGRRQVADLPPVQKGSLAVLAGGKLPTASTASRHIKGHEFLNNFI